MQIDGSSTSLLCYRGEPLLSGKPDASSALPKTRPYPGTTLPPPFRQGRRGFDMQISPTRPLYDVKREFVIAIIEASKDGSPYVYVTFNDPKDYKQSDNRTMNPFGQNAMSFNSIEEMMKNMPKMLGGMAGGQTESPVIKFSMKDYQDMGIKVGDKVSIEITKVEASGI
jgi:hypothetical protein